MCKVNKNRARNFTHEGGEEIDRGSVLGYNDCDKHKPLRKTGEKMSFLNSYKRLENLCNDIYGQENGVTAYIDDMEKNRRGAIYVRGWNEDLIRLKNYRHIRNQIAHEKDIYEEDVCDEDDEEWLELFRERIMNGTDPISGYLNASKQKTAKKQTQYTPNGAKSAGQSTRYYGGYDSSRTAVGYSQEKLDDADYLEMLMGKYGKLYDPGETQAKQTAEKKSTAAPTAQSAQPVVQNGGQDTPNIGNSRVTQTNTANGACDCEKRQTQTDWTVSYPSYTNQNVGYSRTEWGYEDDRKAKKSRKKIRGVLIWLFILLLTAAASAVAYYFLNR